jgi:hypothetical protein
MELHLHSQTPTWCVNGTGPTLPLKQEKQATLQFKQCTSTCVLPSSTARTMESRFLILLGNVSLHSLCCATYVEISRRAIPPSEEYYKKIPKPRKRESLGRNGLSGHTGGD